MDGATESGKPVVYDRVKNRKVDVLQILPILHDE
jgi:hypothetical protein